MNITSPSRERLREHILEERYQGYDPYDALNTSIGMLREAKWPSILAIQTLKRSPINFRPLLGIKKGINPKTLALMLHAFSMDYAMTGSEEFRNKTEEILARLIDLRSPGFEHYCWGYDFQWSSPVKTLKPYSPTAVVSAFVARGLTACYDHCGSDKALDMLRSVGEFITNDLGRTENEHGVCISYSTTKKDVCHNASLLAAEVLSALYRIDGNEEYRKLAHSIASFTVAEQKEDGSWAYSRDKEKERMQIDFHQGYVIDSLRRISDDLGVKEFNSAIENGVLFYRQNQFNEEGRSYWRLPAQWPADIHHQAQGIMTFSDLDWEFAKKIVSYTIRHFQKRDGSFSFRKYRSFTNQITYMRWGNAWMYLAMTKYLFDEHRRK